MLIYKKGNILNAEENIICHQVNVNGVMGRGLAKQIASRYPKVEERYKKYCEENDYSFDVLCGESYIVEVNDNQDIANCYTQFPNFVTDYQSIVDCFSTLLMICKSTNKSICVPYKYGCGIANGYWNKVSKIFESLSDKYKVDIVVYELESSDNYGIVDKKPR